MFLYVETLLVRWQDDGQPGKVSDMGLMEVTQEVVGSPPPPKPLEESVWKSYNKNSKVLFGIFFSWNSFPLHGYTFNWLIWYLFLHVHLIPNCCPTPFKIRDQMLVMLPLRLTTTWRMIIHINDIGSLFNHYFCQTIISWFLQYDIQSCLTMWSLPVTFCHCAKYSLPFFIGSLFEYVWLKYL